jgi:hypothetical protein
MATSTADNQLIERILLEWLEYGYKQNGLTIFDRENGHFMLVEMAWQNEQRVHRVVAHVDLIEGKFWIQVDKTSSGIGNDLEQAGIPKSRIVLAFYPLEYRKHGEYAAQ